MGTVQARASGRRGWQSRPGVSPWPAPTWFKGHPGRACHIVSLGSHSSSSAYKGPSGAWSQTVTIKIDVIESQ